MRRRPQVCNLADDAQPYYQKVKDADAVVIGTPVYFDTMSAMVWAFIERFFGYRHVDIPISGKPFMLVVGGVYHAQTKFERGTNENTNGLLRQFFPKGIDFKKVTDVELDKAVALINNRPRKCLNYRTPNEVLWRNYRTPNEVLWSG